MSQPELHAADHSTADGVNRRSLLAGFGGLLAAGAATSGVLATPALADPASPQRRDARVEALLRKMTLAEKLGQLQLVGDEDTAHKALATGQLGGVFSVVGTAKLNALQHIAVEQTRLGIPLIFGLDVIHGYTTNFPIPLAQGSSFDPSVPGTDATVSASEARRSGIHWTYAPMMDVTHEPRWGRIAEGNGEDPYLVAANAVAKVRGYQGDDISAPDRLAACAKHFVAYGGAEGGRDYNTVDVSIQRLHNLYLPPFKASVEAGVATVMTSFNTISGVPAHGNSYVVHDVLKGRYGFRGFVVSDYTGIEELINHGLAGNGADAATAALTAGVDMEMVSTNYVQYGQQLLAQHRITREQIDDAVRRILSVKFRLGLFEHPYTDESGEVTAPSAAALAKARHAAGRSMVLLKNDGPAAAAGEVGWFGGGRRSPRHRDLRPQRHLVGPRHRRGHDTAGDRGRRDQGGGAWRLRHLHRRLHGRRHGHERVRRGAGGRPGRRRDRRRGRRNRRHERGSGRPQQHRPPRRAAAAGGRDQGDREAVRGGAGQRQAADHLRTCTTTRPRSWRRGHPACRAATRSRTSCSAP